MSGGNTAGPGRRLTEFGVHAVLAGWVVATLAAQHPNVMFHRMSRMLPTGVVLPNWRFFAPNPASTDYHILHRVLEADDTQSEWSETIEIESRRRWHHLFWFPERRRGKAIFDICSSLVRHLNDADVSRTPGYRKLRDLVSVTAVAGHEGPAPVGFQFMLVTHTGFDDEPEPVRIFASGLEPWRVHELTAP